MKLQLKKNGSSLDLKKLMKEHEEIQTQVEELASRERAEERRYIEEEIRQGNLDIQSFGSTSDPKYKFYEALQTPLATNVSFDAAYVYGKKVKDGKVTERMKPLKEDEGMRAIYESFTGGDVTSYTTTQSGVPLKKRQTEGELRLVQLIVNSRYSADPHVRNSIDNLSRYISGNGVRFIVEDPDVEDALEQFFRDTKFADKLPDLIKTSFKDGEVGFIIKSSIRRSIFEQKTKVQWAIHKLLSEEVRGFETHSEDGGIKYTYYVLNTVNGVNTQTMKERWIADINYFYQFNTRDNLVAFDGAKSNNHKELTKDEVSVWFQHGDKKEVRGRVPLEPSLRDFRLLEDFKISRAVLNYERSKVLYIKKEKMQVRRVGASTEIRKSASPKGGVQLTLGPNEDYEMQTASLNAADSDVDGLLFLYSAGAGISTPIYILGMRADQQNYSAIKNTDSPFNQMILDYANEFSAFIEKTLRWVIYRNIELGKLKETVKIKRVAKEKQAKAMRALVRAYTILTKNEAIEEKIIEQVIDDYKSSMEDVDIPTVEIPIEIIIADAVKPNPLEMAKTAFIQRKLGIVSSQTLSERSGFTWQQELMRMLEEKKLGIWPAETPMGQGDSSNAGGGLDVGSNVDDGSGTMAQNSK